MFRTDEIAVAAHNNSKLRQYIQAKGSLVIGHGSKLETALMSQEHMDELRQLSATLFGDNQPDSTYVLVWSKGLVKCYAPRMLLRQKTLQLRWGELYKPVSEIAAIEGVTLLPNIVAEQKFTKYSVSLCTAEGYEAIFRIYLRDGTKLNAGQMLSMLKSGEGWNDVLTRERPTDIRSTVSLDKPRFEFTATGYYRYENSGTTKDGRPFDIAKMVMVAENGDEYELKEGRSRQAQDFEYWGSRVSEDNPVIVEVEFDSIGDYQGKTFNKVNINFTPVNDEVDLAALLDLSDDYIGESEPELTDYDL